jgi:hypothetical protein
MGGRRTVTRIQRSATWCRPAATKEEARRDKTLLSPRLTTLGNRSRAGAARIHRDHDDHSVQAWRLGRFGRRIPGHDREGCVPDEGSRPLRCVCLFTAAGRDKGRALQDGGLRLKRYNAPGSKSDRSSRWLLVLPFIR